MKKTFTIIILTILFGFNNTYAQIEGKYHSVGYFNHPATPRTLLLDKVLYKTNDSIFTTNVGDLADTDGTLVLTIHKNNTVTYENSYVPNGGINYSITATKDSINKYDPLLKNFNLHYEYTLPSGIRSIREVLTKIVLIKKTINLTSPGTLSILLTPTELSNINDLTITGAIDARDFKTMRDKMPYLAKIDISAAAIYSYSGTEGTAGTSSISYSSNTIPDYAFYNSIQPYKTTLTSISMPTSTRYIGNYAFNGCSGLTCVLSIPSSVSSIGNYAFAGCSGLTGPLTIPSGVNSIGNYAFAGCSGLSGSLTIPKSVYILGTYVFSGCKGLKGALSISSTISCINEGVFQNCSGLTGTLTIPSGIWGILNYAFAGCSGFTGVLTIPTSVIHIMDNAFDGCRGFTGQLTIPSNIQYIGTSAFRDCSGLTGTLTIPTTVSSIDAYAFSGCKSFTGTLVIPSSVTFIGEYVFNGCSGLTGSLVIPSSVKSIGNYTFSDCSGFTGSLVIPSTVTAIGSYAFNGCTGFTGTLVIPSVTSIGSNSFAGCSGLTGTLTIPSSVTTIGTYAFNGCSGFTGTLVIPSSVTTIGANAFSGSGAFTAIYTYLSSPANASLGTSVFGGIPKNTCTLYVPLGKKGLYTSAEQWKDFENIIDGVPASVSTQAVTNTDTTSPIGNGTITDFDTNNPTQFGVVWSPVPAPTVSLSSKTVKSNPLAKGQFTTAITDLMPNTFYYLRAYTTNSAGTCYGEEVTFKTLNPQLAAPSKTSLAGFTTIMGKASASQTFTISANTLGDKLIVTAPLNFEVRESGIGTFGSSVSFAPVSGVVSSKTIEVRIAQSNSGGRFSGNVVCSSTWATDQIVTVSGEVTLKILTITDPTVVTNKMVDGNTNAFITQIGTLQGIDAADAGNVVVTAIATYDNATVGTTKTITVVYTLTGSAKDKYLAPANDIITNAKISDYITLSPLSAPTPGCEGSSMDLHFHLLTGTPVQYKITFNAAALNAGMKNIGYRDLSNANSAGTLTFSVPGNTQDGTYQGTLKMNNELYLESIDYPFTFTINVSADNILTKFNYLVMYNNFSNRFTGFQWYKNGVEIAGATKQFYVDPTGLVGSYSLKLTTTDNQTLYSCPRVLNIPASKVKVNISTIPNPVRIQSSCSIQIDGLNNEQLKDGKLSVFNLQGICVYESSAIENVNKLNLPATGVYIVHLTASGNDYMFKIIVTQ